ncbi:MAG: sugar ABC transporter substrate-binding protein [Clostridia bacterium]|nr:sugar ABC transporter substrate-binding protein [Clostridia bacterium]
METFSKATLNEFCEKLASSAPVPGGGGAAAMAGAMGAALGCMVCRLTVGKPKYKESEENILSALNELESLRARMLCLVDGDAAGFGPLEEAWSLPKDDPTRAEKLEAALHSACGVPTAVIEDAEKTIGILSEVAEIGVKSAISDIGVGVELCKTAILASRQNIFINASLMKDENLAAELRVKYYMAEARILPTAEKALKIVAKRVG